ncbi:MAG: Ldh family oxidoreductase [Bacteroidales bacterium]|nr:Ldh family oxidoreductase [Bacteroidales bacterium]
MIYLGVDKLKEVMAGILRELRVDPESVSHLVDSVVEASLKGIDTHGLALFPHYVEGFSKGRITKRPQFKIVKDNGSAKLIDADGAIGHHAGIFAMDFCIDMASRNGSGVVAVRNSSHFGAASYFTEYAARHDMMAFAFTNTNSLVKAHGAVEPFFGTNPICFSCPMDGEEPLCLDMATSIISWNYVRNHKETHQMLDDGLAYDETGHFTTDPYKARCVRPIGDYKGFGLGMMVEIMCSVLSGSEIGHNLMPMFGSDMTKKRGISHCFHAIDIRKFTNIKQFRERMKNLAAIIRGMQPLEGQEVMLPGDPEKRAMKNRLANGIPVAPNVWKSLLEVSPKFADAVIREE